MSAWTFLGNISESLQIGFPGRGSPAVLRLAASNAKFQAGMSTPLDDAVNAAATKAGGDVVAETHAYEISCDVVCTRGSFWRHRPFKLRLASTSFVFSLTLAIVCLLFGLIPSPSR
jgi:hypothetical protein